jgi:5-formyltetrahydrofolate cyclo-ligase
MEDMAERGTWPEGEAGRNEAGRKKELRRLALARRDAIPAFMREQKSVRICDELLLEMCRAFGVGDGLGSEGAGGIVGGGTLPGKIVAVYAAKRSEVSLDRFIRAVHEHGGRLCFPCMQKNVSRETFPGEQAFSKQAADFQYELPDREQGGQGLILSQKLRARNREAPGTVPGNVSRETFPAVLAATAPMVFREVSFCQYEAHAVPFVGKPLRSFAADDPALECFPTVAPGVLDVVVVPLVAFDARLGRLGYGGGNYDRILRELRPGAFVAGAAFAEQQVGEVPLEGHDLCLPRIVSA